MTTESAAGVIRIASRHSVAQTVDRLTAALKHAGIKIFAHIVFDADARNVGLAMRPEQLLLFGNPKAGTPLLVAMPSVGLDLPLRALVWEEPDERVWVAHNDPQYIIDRHHLPLAFAENLSAVIPLIVQAAN
jgi:uncharacterized protein (DUF302 family)